MTLADLPYSAVAFQATLASGDFSLAGAALSRYLESLGAGRASLAEIEQARAVIDCALRDAVERRTGLARELSVLRQLQRGYRLQSAANTWEISG